MNITLLHSKVAQCSHAEVEGRDMIEIDSGKTD